MREGRWTTVTESEFDHERRGLESIREKLPDCDPWRAWSNFTFTANTGHVREVDLLVIAPGGVCVIELKNWHGSLTSENGTWVQTTHGGGVGRGPARTGRPGGRRPDTPTAPGLLDYAVRLGRTADRLAKLDTLPTATTVLGELGALTPPPGTLDWDERRLVELAAAASLNAAATPRLPGCRTP